MVKRRQRAGLRRTMRGYQALRKSGAIDRIALLKKDLTEHRLDRIDRGLSATVMGAGSDHGEVVVRQYLLVRIAGLNLTRALLTALGKKNGRVVFPLPREWREVLVRHGFKVARIRSSLLWFFYVSALWLYGLLQIGRIFWAGLFAPKEKGDLRKPHVGFSDLGPGNLPQPVAGGQSHDVISWYLQWLGRVAGIAAVRHTVAKAQPQRLAGVEVVPARHILPDLSGARALAGYGFWGLGAGIIAAFDGLRGRWWHAVMLNQAALAAQVRFLPAEVLAKDYLFHNSGWIYRPLWTYDAQARGAAITFYFYSTNCESFKREKGWAPLPYGWKAMNWPRYLVWNEYQADFVTRAAGAQANISIVGAVWFQSSSAAMPQIIKPGVAVFDVTPFRQSRYCLMGFDYEYYTPENCGDFLQHIDAAIQQVDAVMLWKRKREIGTMAHPRYRQLAERMAENGHVVLVDPGISALRVIESSCAVISMPFTSTALIAKEIGKPSVYYDPMGLLQRDDRAAHGVPILSGEEQLRSWLRQVTKGTASQAVDELRQL